MKTKVKNPSFRGNKKQNEKLGLTIGRKKARFNGKFVEA